MSFTVDLQGRTAVITGGAGVLGSCFARALAAQGASVAVLDLHEEAAGKVTDEIIAEGGKAIGIGADVLDTQSLKAAVSNFTQWLAVHLAKVNIRVNAIAPGFFETVQNRALLRDTDGSYSERARKILSQTPQGRFGLPEELLGTLLWLGEPEASGFVNRVVIPVDGGFSAYSGV